MDKRSVIGLVLIGAILLVYSLYTANNTANKQKEQEDTPGAVDNAGPGKGDDSPAEDSVDYTEAQTDTPANNVTTAEIDTSLVSDTTLANGNLDSLLRVRSLQEDYGVFWQAAEQSETEPELYTIENENLVVELSTQGGMVHKVRVKGYETADSMPLILFNGSDEFTNALQFYYQNDLLTSADFRFDTEGSSFKVTGKDTNRIAFRLYAGNKNSYIEQEYSLAGTGYMVEYDVTLVGMDKVFPRNNGLMRLQMEQKLRRLEKHKEVENQKTKLFYKYYNGSVESLSESKERDEEEFKTKAEWISFKQQFFNTTIMSDEAFSYGEVESVNRSEETDPYLKEFRAGITMPYEHGPQQQYDMAFYFGPNSYPTLHKLDNDLEDVIPLGRGIMSWVSYINKYGIIPIFNLLESANLPYWAIIIVLTLTIKLVLSPLTYRSYKSQAKMKLLKPELDELKEKYKDDQQKFGSEQMKLYQKAGVNPLGGCLPMLLQMPFLIAMYYFFPSSIELRQEAFLWASDLSTYDTIANLPFTIPLYGDHVSLFTLLMTASSILYAVTNQQQFAGAGNQNMAMMKYMPYIFPIFLLGIFNSFPAALTFYYFLSNLITYGQQFVIKRFIIDEDKLHKQLQANKKKPRKKGGWQDRLEKMMREQQKQAQERQKGKGGKK